MDKSKRGLKVCIIIPAYNEAAVIEKVIKSVFKEFSKSHYAITVLVVNDSSKDDTAVKAKKAGATVVSHILNTGVGGATATGLKYAKNNGFDVAATMDADGQHDPKDVHAGIDTIIQRNVDLLIGSRLISSTDMSKLKIIGNKGLGLVTYLLFGVNSTDSQSGLRVFSQKSLNKLYWETDGYEFCSEMLWRAKQQRLIIGEYPIRTIYTNYSRQKGQNNWNAINIVKTLLKRRVLELFG